MTALETTIKHRTAVLRLRLLAAVGLAVLLSAVAPPLAGSEEEFVAGSGNAYAQVYRVGPTAARLSLAPVIGLSLADYVNTVGRGEAKAADWAGLGVAERSLPDNTPTLRVSSTDEDSEEGRTEVTAGQKDASGLGGGAVELFARATDAPFGESGVRISGMSIPGLIDFANSVAHTTSGIIKGNLRRSTSIVEIGRIDLAGVVRLTGLKWEAIQQTGPGDNDRKLTGRFTVEGASIGGVPLPISAGGDDFEAVLGPINAALAPTGFAVTPPKVEERSGQQSVSPLSFEIVNSPLGRQFLAPILAALQPAREPIADAFIDLAKALVEANEEFPDASVAVLAADLTLGVFSGSSQLHIELGGVNAFTEGESFADAFGFGEFRPPGVVPPQTVFSPGTPGRAAVPGVPADEGTLVASPAGPPAQRTIPGGRGGLAAIAGLVALFVAAGLATRDYWKMRKIREATTT